MAKKIKLTSTHKPIKVLDGIPMLIVCVVIVVALYVLGIAKILPNSILRIILNMLLYIVLGEMWNLLSGFTGMTSLGQQLFIGLAGYSVAVMTTSFKMSLVVGILVGAGIAIVMALLLSLILFRMRGMYFAIATWVVAEAVSVWFSSWSFVGGGGGTKVTAKPYPQTLTIYIMAVTLFVIAMVAVYLLLRTKTGLGLTAMRDDADAASAVGVNIFKSKLLVYVIAAFFCALAGAVFFINKGTIYPSGGFGINWTVAMVFIVILGGIGTVSGPILGGIIYTLLYEILAKYCSGWSNIILGAIAILVILFLPDGIMGTLQKKLHFEIFSQKRFSAPKGKIKDAANAI